jgi:hypothetical protein
MWFVSASLTAFTHRVSGDPALPILGEGACEVLLRKQEGDKVNQRSAVPVSTPFR